MSNQEKDDVCTNVGFYVPDNSNMDRASSDFSTSDVVSKFDGQLLLMSEKSQSSSQIVIPNSADICNISQEKYQVYLRVKRLLQPICRTHYDQLYAGKPNYETLWNEFVLQQSKVIIINTFSSSNTIEI